MSKRFPIPEFNRDLYKNRPWNPPKMLASAEQQRLISAARNGDRSAYGCYPVEADAAILERFKVTGPNAHAVMCIVPPNGVTLTGRSWAWEIQRAIVLDSLDARKATVLQDWKTPRPMNTRLGPENGVPFNAPVAYVLCGHRYGDHWIGNRTLADGDAARANGFALISSSDEQANDFHACNLSFTWA